MKDKDKTKEQLIKELVKIRQKLAEFEKSKAERKRAEEALKAERQQLYNVLETVPIMVCLLTPDYHVAFANRAFRDKFGESHGRRCYEYCFGKKEPCDFCEAYRVLKTAKPHHWQVTTADGASVIDVYDFPFSDVDGSPMILEMDIDITEHKRIEDALRESEERFRSVVQTANDGIIIIGSHGNVVFWNQSAEVIFGYSADEMLSKPLTLIMPERFREGYERGMQRLLSMEEPKTDIRSFEAVGIRKGGSEFPLELSLAIWKTRKGIFIMSIVRDITERKKAENLLRASEEKYRALMNDAVDAILLADEKGHILEVNKKAEELLGYPKEELMNIHVSQLHPPKERERVFADFKELVEKGRGTFRDGLVLRKDGKVIPVDIAASMIEYAGKRIAQGIFRDISERKKAEEEMRESEERFRLLAESANDAIITGDIHGKIIFCNKAAEELSGYSANELIGKTYYTIVPKRYHGDQQKWLKHVRETGRPPILRKASEGTILKKDGSESPVEVSTAIWAARDQPFLTVILRDTSERKKMEEELIKTSKLESLGILAGGIAHDFNNILTALLGNVSIAKTSVNPEDSLFKRLTEAEKACLRAKDLTQQLLTFSKGGAPIKKTVSLGELLKESADFALRGSNVRCEFSIAEDLWPVEIDEGQINQVINNLIINADQAMPEGGTIEIHAENTLLEAQDGLLLPEGKYVKISIKDQGVGIPREYLIKIFDPYFTTKYKGSGLGLSTSYSIIKNHDGHIDVESQLGVGTIFTIHLPASKKKIPAMKRFKETPISGKGRILVMDDEETIRNLLFDMLKDLGYEVELVKDGNETIESYKKARYSGHPFDAVIMDLTIPGGMGGKEAIKILREIDPQLKAIVSSGFSNDPIMSDFHKYGFKGVIAKPYNVEDMSRILHRVITGK